MSNIKPSDRMSVLRTVAVSNHLKTEDLVEVVLAYCDDIPRRGRLTPRRRIMNAAIMVNEGVVTHDELIETILKETAGL